MVARVETYCYIIVKVFWVVARALIMIIGVVTCCISLLGCLDGC